MNNALLGPLAAGVLALATASPVAAGHKTVTGGCFLQTAGQRTVTNGTYAGFIGVRAVVRDGSGAPASATIGCKVQIDGTDWQGHVYGGFGVVAGAHPTSFTVAEDAAVDLCQNVDGEGWDCGWLGPPLPPQAGHDLVGAAFDLLGTLWDPRYEEVPCAVLAGAGGTYGVVTIHEDGDVATDQGTLWDCPPYAW